MGALLRTSASRHSRGSFQEACLRRVKTWPQNASRGRRGLGIFARRNAAMDDCAAAAKRCAADRAAISTRRAESPLAEQLDGPQYRAYILRLLFICCHPERPASKTDRAALRTSRLSVKQISRDILVGEDGRPGACAHPPPGRSPRPA